MGVMEWQSYAFQTAQEQIFREKVAFQKQTISKEKRCSWEMGNHNEGFSDGKRVFKGAFQSICKDVSDKDDIHKRSRGWKDESFNKEVDVREKEINKHMQKGKGRFPTATEPLIQRVTDKVNAISQVHS